MSPIFRNLLQNVKKTRHKAPTNKKLRYLRGTALRAISVDIVSNAAQLYEKIPFEEACNR